MVYNRRYNAFLADICFITSVSLLYLGFIVTNAHVVSASKDNKVFITMWDGRKLQGFIHSLDIKSDIALVKIHPSSMPPYEELPVAKLGK